MRKNNHLEFSIYRYNQDIHDSPYMESYFFNMEEIRNMMLSDVLFKIKKKDPTFSFRISCRQGVCGSDGMNINGRNGLACITSIKDLLKKCKKVVVKPLTGFTILKDLVVNMSDFFDRYKEIFPYIIENNENGCIKKRNHIQSISQRNKLNGLYGCILCACCSSSCPSVWWNTDKFIGPAGLLTSYRFLSDDRDHGKNFRLNHLQDSFKVFKCHNIMNCISSCPKNLNPNRAIRKIKIMLLKNMLNLT
ncbi:succinate dehydrogenase iron-sulfur subunit [Candidatus Riesia pediculischaeffi]|uniref:Succinate dehydrogenase iron-sulfur subunit n=1 Tax=Candidatus Riesia pediculischaeffi TaxID=428411 RepID=A0A1V0HL25_9ENTR|nr:succinate dehydrogenase iron-sulfur subunit [Candidatus Riesia pediculischaeffi]ARC53528.1 succinate dehydrogenase [Candidatus Riesia pediculischaeffi]